jgi:hypothetical protein
MGLLDDAIREHLELKRRRGASTEELERQEHEALGPARRGEFAKPEGEAALADETPAPPAAAPEAPEPELETEAEPEPVAEEPPAAPPPVPVDAPEPPEFEPAPAAADAPEPPEFEPAPAAAAPPRESEPWLDEPDEVPADDALEHHTPPPEPTPDVAKPESDPDGEDVLEETPDFLQETPEHDRLWFEQKPPRDFDFDK